MSSSSLTEMPLLRTKISIPQMPLISIKRSRLTAQVHRGVEGSLTLISAPAGFGKTSLLLEWARETRLPVAWLTLDSDDNDLGRFFRYLIGSLQTLEAGLGEEARDFTQSSTGVGLEGGLTLLINDLSRLSKEIALVLDDFQVLENPQLLRGVAFLLQYLPGNLHLVIASRSEPDLDLAFLRARGRVVEVSADDLRFTAEEMEQYFRQAVGLTLSPETIQALEDRTAGWITSLHMAAIFLKNQADPASLLAKMKGSAYHLAGFLAEEILDRQPAEVRQFLLRSSILETLSGPLCEAVVHPGAQPGYGAVMLNRLEHAQLFISALDDKHEWFRYHPLFADFLRQVELEANPGEVPELHKRAALWFVDSGDLGSAFRHALDSRDEEWAADLIVRNALPMINMGEVTAMVRWIGRLNDEVIRKRPFLILAYAWTLIVTHQSDSARYWLDDLQRLIDQYERQKPDGPRIDDLGSIYGDDERRWSILRGGLALCESLLAMAGGAMQQAAEFSQQAAIYLEDEEPYSRFAYYRSIVALNDSIYSILSGDTQKAVESLRAAIRIARQAKNQFVVIIAGCALADMQSLQGQLNKAWETLQRMKFWAEGPDGTALPLAGLVDMGLGQILLEHDLLDEAKDYLERGVQVTRSLWYMGSLHGVISLARLRQAMGDLTGTLEVIDEAARMALNKDASEWDDVIAAVVAVRLALQRGDLPAAEQWWKKGGFPELNQPFALESYPYHVFEYLLLTQVLFLLVKGQDSGRESDILQAAELLEMLYVEAERFQRVTSLIQILVLQAMVQNALGKDEAKGTLLRALALGEPEGYRRIFLDEGERLVELLRQCRAEQQNSGSHLPSLSFIDSLLEALRPKEIGQKSGVRPLEPKAQMATARLEDGFPIALSAREMDVLVLIAAGKSNQEISAELYLALNTVKRHAYNIFAKLEVKKRTQAVSRARQLGLIP